MKTDKFQNKYRIPSARAQWHDYNGGEYFISICTAGREHYFGKIRDGEMILNVLGEFVAENIRQVSEKNNNTGIPLFVVMPNHIHLIVCIDDPNGGLVEMWPAASRIDDNKIVETWPAASKNHEIDFDRNGFRDATGHETDLSNNGFKDATGHVSTGGIGKSEKMREIANQCGLLSTTIGGIKSALTRYARANGIQFAWQTRFHDHIIRSQDEMNRIACYIENNVTTWDNDKFNTK